MKYSYLNMRLLHSVCFFMFGYFLDTVSTYYMISIKNFGIQSEVNVIARWFFKNFGMLWGNVLHFLPCVLLISAAFLYPLWLKFVRRRPDINNAIKNSYIITISLFWAIGAGSMVTALLNVLWPYNIVISGIIIITIIIVTGLTVISYLEKINKNSAE